MTTYLTAEAALRSLAATAEQRNALASLGVDHAASADMTKVEATTAITRLRRERGKAAARRANDRRRIRNRAKNRPADEQAERNRKAAIIRAGRARVWDAVQKARGGKTTEATRAAVRACGLRNDPRYSKFADPIRAELRREKRAMMAAGMGSIEADGELRMRYS